MNSSLKYTVGRQVLCQNHQCDCNRIASMFVTLYFQRKLQAYIAHGGYTAEPMILGQVHILGIEIGPTSVMVNGNSTMQYAYKEQVLSISEFILSKIIEGYQHSIIFVMLSKMKHA